LSESQPVEATRDEVPGEFVRRATELAAEHTRDGLPLRGRIQVFGYIGTKP